jgi:hypothetical protein
VALAAGSTLLIDSGPQGKHLHAVVLGPVVIEHQGDVPQFVLVGITTRRQGAHHDPACTLNVGDHRFIRHESFAAYRFARAERVAHVEAMVRSGAWREHEPCNAALLARLVAGARVSDHLRGDLQALFNP